MKNISILRFNDKMSISREALAIEFLFQIDYILIDYILIIYL